MIAAAITGIESLLAQHIGLDVESIGRAAIGSAIATRMAAIRIASAADYLDALASAGELAALIEEIVVCETWFLRDRVPFTHLAEHAVSTRPARRGEPFRVLSVPCSTGEEPYSIAIALLDAGLAPAEFAIDAVDVSARALAAGARGVYGAASFRGDDIGFREHYLRPVDAGWEVSEPVRRSVRFTQGNLLDRELMLPADRYHAIFCRNLLIYLTAAARGVAISKLGALLEPAGLFVVGHAERSGLIDAGFRPLAVTGAFTFARESAPPRPRAATAPLGASTPWKPPANRPPARVSPPPRVAPSPPPVKLAPRDLLAEAARLADRGQLAQAAAMCTEYFERAGPDAASCALLGTIHQADGKLDEAEAMFSRALYCDPRHYESLVHLALLRERQGDRASAENLRRRAANARSGRGER